MSETEIVAAMDFVEKLFHVSPDGGNGTCEAVIVLLAGLLIVAGLLFRFVRIRSARKYGAEKEKD